MNLLLFSKQERKTGFTAISNNAGKLHVTMWKVMSFAVLFIYFIILFIDYSITRSLHSLSFLKIFSLLSIKFIASF